MAGAGLSIDFLNPLLVPCRWLSVTRYSPAFTIILWVLWALSKAATIVTPHSCLLSSRRPLVATSYAYSSLGTGSLGRHQSLRSCVDP